MANQNENMKEEIGHDSPGITPAEAVYMEESGARREQIDFESSSSCGALGLLVWNEIHEPGRTDYEIVSELLFNAMESQPNDIDLDSDSPVED